jgi:hypothetical protein
MLPSAVRPGAIVLAAAVTAACHLSQGGGSPTGATPPTAVGRPENVDVSSLRSCLIGVRWLHSHEEDRADVTVYRPGGFAFPPSRGRVGFLLEASGRLVYEAIARGDGTERLEGQWALTGAGSLTLDLPGTTPSIHLDIVSCAPDRLEARTRSSA